MSDGSWFENAIIYGLDVETFRDGNGDGIGDFDGLIEKLDYLVSLGITCIWLLPFYPTPNRDNGYDISQYLDVDRRHGDLDDFIAFVRRAKEHGLRVMTDLVVNHTSNKHPWFQAARHNPRSRFRDFYIWSDDPPPTPADGGTIFPGEESTVWTFDEAAGRYYYHRFYHFQPSLNPTNPAVVAEIERVIDFWISLGADALRLDAAPHLIAGSPEARPEDPHALLRRFRGYLDERWPDVAFMGEADEEPSEVASFFGDGDELHMLLNFYLCNYLFLGLAEGSARPVAAALQLLPRVPDGCAWANFLRNLDELDLERLTEEERGRVLEAFAPQQDMRIFGRGIRRRLAPMLGDGARLRMAQALLFSMPGAPVLMYGDEIGMGEDLALPGRTAVRPPMQWSDGRNAGFSDAPAGDVVRHPVAEGPFAYGKVNVEAQQEDPRSTLNFTRRLVSARRSAPEIGRGDLHILAAGNDAVLAHRLKGRESRVVCLHNLSGEGQEVDLSLPRSEVEHLRLFLSSREEVEEGAAPGPGGTVELEPYGVRWYRATEV